jgi:hypothetical protein
MGVAIFVLRKISFDCPPTKSLAIGFPDMKTERVTIQVEISTARALHEQAEAQGITLESGARTDK